jgi:hypothetical protein
MSNEKRKLILKSTRSLENNPALSYNPYKEMDGFDLQEEIARLRRAVFEVDKLRIKDKEPWTLPEVLNYNTANEYGKLLGFISEAVFNIDEWMRTFGSGVIK